VILRCEVLLRCPGQRNPSRRADSFASQNSMRAYRQVTQRNSNGSVRTGGRCEFRANHRLLFRYSVVQEGLATTHSESPYDSDRENSSPPDRIINTHSVFVLLCLGQQPTTTKPRKATLVAPRPDARQVQGYGAIRSSLPSQTSVTEAFETNPALRWSKAYPKLSLSATASRRGG
jgi:hypothetical protein